MHYLTRRIQQPLLQVLERGKSVLLLGPRQTGKTTLLSNLGADRFISLVDVRQRHRYEREPGALADEIEALAHGKAKRPLIIIDEIQKVPSLLDVAQDIIDRKITQCVLTGSSARKLRRGHDLNLLPGRLISLAMDPLTLKEWSSSSLEELLVYGSLPEVVQIEGSSAREELLNAYVNSYLEEEVRAEALVRQLGPFVRFLELAAGESGYPINFSKLSQAIGIAHSTISHYFQLLEDCLIVERVEPLTDAKSRRRLMKGCKYLFFDLGVRRVAAREGVQPPLSYMGHLFEQWVGLELIRLTRERRQITVRFWRDHNGPEVDWVLDYEGKYIPIKVKWNDLPSHHDGQHLHTFMQEYPSAREGYLVCRTPHRMRLGENLWAIPWQELAQLIPL